MQSWQIFPFWNYKCQLYGTSVIQSGRTMLEEQLWTVFARVIHFYHAMSDKMKKLHPDISLILALLHKKLELNKSRRELFALLHQNICLKNSYDSTVFCPKRGDNSISKKGFLDQTCKIAQRENHLWDFLFGVTEQIYFLEENSISSLLRLSQEFK